jgi:hypothetical protein
MKRLSLVVFLVAAMAVLPLAAQDFSSPKAQFISFSLGVPVGYSLAGEDIAAGQNLGLSFAIIDNLQIGYDHVSVTAAGTTPSTLAYNLIRVAYSFTDTFGAAVSFGSGGVSGAASTAATGIGAYADLFQKRAPIGFAYGIRIRVDYLANTDAFGDGTLAFGLGVNFGL